MQSMDWMDTSKSAKKTYSTGDSLVVTDPTTSPAISGLSMGEQTGSRVLHYLWPYVLDLVVCRVYIDVFAIRYGNDYRPEA
jgi:hypothetical protein